MITCNRQCRAEGSACHAFGTRRALAVLSRLRAGYGLKTAGCAPIDRGNVFR